MGVELYLAVVAKSSMFANLTHTDIVLLQVRYKKWGPFVWHTANTLSLIINSYKYI